MGSDRAGFPEAPGLTPLPPGSGISGVRDEGQLHPLLPSGSGIPPANGRGGFGLCPSWLPLDRELQFLVAPTPPPKPLRLAPCPPLPLPGLAWCVPGTGRKQTRWGGFAGSGVTLTQLQQSLMADTHSACSGGTVAVARKPAAA